MTIIIEDRQVNSRYEMRYLATFFTEKIALKSPYAYPVEVNPNDAEKMLLILECIISIPEVFNYFITILPNNISAQEDLGNFKNLIQEFINGLTSPPDVKVLNWNFENMEYIMRNDSLEISTRLNNFFFLFGTAFIDTFIESFGQYQWNRLDPMQVIDDREFIEADNFVNDALSPYETWFVAADKYDELCMQIKTICMKLESLSGHSFFNWNSTLENEIRLISIIKDDAEAVVK